MRPPALAVAVAVVTTMLSMACRSSDKQRPAPDPVVVVTPLDAAAAATTTITTMIEAGRAPDAGGVVCGDANSNGFGAPAPIVQNLAPLSVDLFPKDQRQPKRADDWRVPARFEEEQPPPLKDPMRKAAIVLGDATLTKCEALFSSARESASGPFEGIVSDESWVATVYGGERGALLVVRDGTKAIRAVRHLRQHGPNTGSGLKELTIFPGGKNLVAWMYDSADGTDEHYRWLIGFRDGELRVLFTAEDSAGMGSLERFDLLPGPGSPSANPQVVVAFASRETTGSLEDGGFTTLKPQNRKKTVRWDAAKQTFR